MCIIAGVIFNNEVVIATKCKVDTIDSKFSGEDCVTEVISYHFEPEIFHVILTGRDIEIRQFNLKLVATNFIGPFVSRDLFVTTCYDIIKQQSLSHISILIVIFDKRPILCLVSGRRIETESEDSNYLLGISGSSALIDKFKHPIYKIECFSSKADILIFIQNVFTEIMSQNEVPSQSLKFSYALITEQDKNVEMKYNNCG